MTERPIIFSAPMVQAILAGRKSQTRRVLGPGTTLFDGGGWTKAHKAQTWDWAGAWVNPGPSPAGNPGPYLKLPWLAGDHLDVFGGTVHRIYPILQPGDRLWVKETCRAEELSYPPSARPATRKEKALYGRRLVTVLDEMDGADGVRYLADQSWRRIENTHDAGERWSEMYHSGRGGKHGVGSTISPRLMPRWASRLTLLVTEVRVQRLQGISEEDAIAEGMLPQWGPTAAFAFRRTWESLHGPGSWDANPFVAAVSFRREGER